MADAPSIRAATFLSGIPAIGFGILHGCATQAVLRWMGRLDDDSAVAIVADPATLTIGKKDATTVEADLFVRDGKGRNAIRRGTRVLIHGYADEGREGVYHIDIHAPARTALDAVVFRDDLDMAA